MGWVQNQQTWLTQFLFSTGINLFVCGKGQWDMLTCIVLTSKRLTYTTTDDGSWHGEWIVGYTTIKSRDVTWVIENWVVVGVDLEGKPYLHEVIKKGVKYGSN